MSDEMIALVPILSVIGFFAWLLAISPVGRAFGERLRQRPGPAPDLGEFTRSLDELRRDVAELAERMDFTERLLAERREATRLPPPGSEP